MDRNLLLLASAIQGSLNGDDKDDKKFARNITDCFSRVKTYCEQNGLGDKEYLTFRMNTCVVLILACKSVRESCDLTKLEELLPVVNGFPILDESTYLNVTRSQKNYRFIFSTLIWFPPEVVANVCMEFGKNCLVPTPVTLAMSEQLMKAVLFTYQHTHSENIDYKSLIEVFITFFKSKVVNGETSANIKLSGFVFMYLTKCMTHLCKLIAHKLIDKPEDVIGLASIIKNKWSTQSTKTTDVLTLVPVVKDLFEIVESNVKNISVDIWMSWCDINLPVTIAIKQTTLQCNNMTSKPKNVQTSIANDAFCIIQNLTSTNDQMVADLRSNFSVVFDFYQKVSADPDYDPDSDLSSKDLIEQIKLKDDRFDKLLLFLLNKEDIFELEAVPECLSNNIKHIPKSMYLPLFNKFLETNKDNIDNYESWLQCALNIASCIPSPELLEIIQNKLSCGVDDRLKSGNFENHLTSVFNQLAGSTESNVKSISNDKDQLIWLCLQSGRDVVRLAVNISVTLSGLAGVIVQALSTIPCVMLAIDPDTGYSVITTVLSERFNNGFNDKETTEFLSLVKGLTEENSKVPIINPKELLEVLVYPNLSYSSKSSNSSNLIIALTTLKYIVSTCDKDHVFSSSPDLSTLQLTLLQIIDATKYLEVSTTQELLDIRQLACDILHVFKINEDKFSEEYKRDRSYIKQYLYQEQISLHPRSIFPYTALLDCDIKGDNSAIPLQVIKFIYSSESSDISTITLLQTELEEIQWIWFLYQELPHCNKSEWIQAFIATEVLFKLNDDIIQLLRIFHQILYLMCIYSTCLTKEPAADDHVNGTDQNNTNGVLHDCPDNYSNIEGNIEIDCEHVFRTFSSAFSSFLVSKIKNEKKEEKVKIISSIICWWNENLICFQCDNETLPLLLLGCIIEDLCNFLYSASGLKSKHDEDQESKEKDLKIDGIIEGEFENITKSIINHVPVCSYSSGVIRKYLHLLED